MQTGTINDITNLKFFSDKGNEIPMHKKYILTWEFIPGKLAQNYMQANLSGYFIGDVDLSNPSNIQIAKNSLMTSILEKGSIFVRLSTTAMTDENKMPVFSYDEIDSTDNSVFYNYIKKILMDVNNKVKVSININDQSFTHTYAFKQVFTLNNITENFEDYFTITKIYTGNNTEGTEQEYYILLNVDKIDLVPLKKDPATSFIQQVFENNVPNIGLYFPFFRYYGDFYQDKVSSKFIAANTILVLEEQYSNDNNTTYNKPYISSSNQYSLVFQPELQSELKIISNDSVYNIEYKSEAAFSLADAEVSTTYVTPFSFSIGFCAETEGAYQNLLGIYVRSLDNTDIAFFAGVISIKSEVEAEDERFRTLLGNFGIPDPISYSNLFAKQDFAEEGLDYKLINEKSKELFINYSDIFSYVGTYKALINAVKYLGYYDIVFKEWYTLLDTNDHETDIAVQAYDTNTGEYLKSKLAQYGVSIEDFRRYNKINKLSMIYHLNEEIDTYEYIDQTLTEFSKEQQKYIPIQKYTKLSEVPLTRPIYEYRNEEILAKLLSVKNWLEENIIGVGAYISDITGEGVYFGWQKTQAYHTQHDLYDFSNNQYYTPNYKEVQKFTNSSTTISCTLNELNGALTFSNYEHTPIEAFNRFNVSLNLKDSTGVKSDIDNIVISNSIESPVLGDEYEFEVAVMPPTGTLYEWCKNSATQIYINDGEINLLFDDYYEANIDADKLPIITLENANIHKCYGKWQENIKWGIREVIDQETGNTNYKLVNFKLYDKVNYEIHNNSYLILYPTTNDAYIKYTQHNKWDIPLFVIKGYKFLNYIPNAEYINEFDLTDGEYILEIIKGDVLFKQEGNVSAQLSFSLDNENKLSEQEINVHYKYQSPKMPFTYIDYTNIQNTIDSSIFDYSTDIYNNVIKNNNASIYWDSLLYDISTKIKTSYTNVAYNEASTYINSTVKSEYDAYINMLIEQIVKENLYNDYVNIYSDNYTFNQYIDVSVNRLGNYSILTKAYDKYNNIYTSEYDKLVNVTTTPIQYNIITPYDYSNNSPKFHSNNAYGRKLEEGEIDALIIDVSKNTPEYPVNYKIYDFEYNTADNSVEFDNISYAIDTPKNNDYIVFENCSERCDHIEVNETDDTTIIYMFDENPNQNNIYNIGVSVSIVIYDKLHNKDVVCVGPYKVIGCNEVNSSNDTNYTADSYIVVAKNLISINEYFNNPRYTAYILNTTEYELSNLNTTVDFTNNSTTFTLDIKAFNIEDVVKLRYYDNNKIINETTYRITSITENIDPSTYLVNNYTFEINGLINTNVIQQYVFNDETQQYEIIDNSKYKTVITYAHEYPVHYFAQIIGNAVERNRNIGYDGWSIINTKFNYNSTKLFLDDYIDDTYSGYIYKYDPVNLKRMWLNLYNTIDNTADLYEYKMPTTIKQGDVIILSSKDDKNIFLPGYASTWTWKTDTLDDNDNIIDYKKNNAKTTVFKSINNILTLKPNLLGSQDIELQCVDIYGNRVINDGSGMLYVNKNNNYTTPDYTTTNDIINYITNTKSKLKWKYNKADKTYNVKITQLAEPIVHNISKFTDTTNIIDTSSSLVIDKTGRYNVQFTYNAESGNVDTTCECIQEYVDAPKMYVHIINKRNNSSRREAFNIHESQLYTQATVKLDKGEYSVKFEINGVFYHYTEINRENSGNVVLISGNNANTLKADITGNYIFKYVLKGNVITIDYPEYTTNKKSNPFVYNLKLNIVDDTTYVFSYTANEVCTASLQFFDANVNSLVKSVPLGNIKKGNNTTTLLSYQIPQNVELIWGIVFVANKPELLDGNLLMQSEILDMPEVFNYYHPTSITINNNTESDTFGNIYVSCIENISTPGNNSISRNVNQSAGIFVYTPNFNSINTPTNQGICPMLPTGYTIINNTSAKQYIQYNNQNDSIYWNYNEENKDLGVFQLSTNLKTSINNGITAGQSQELNNIGVIADMCIDNSTIYVLIEKISTKTYYIYSVHPTGISLLHTINVNAAATYSDATPLKMVCDGRGGFWIIANTQISITSKCALLHVNNNGTVDYSVTPSNLKGFNNTDLFSNVIACNTNDNILAIVKNNVVELYSINYSNMTLTNIASTNTLYDISDMAFDYAGNLYVIDKDTNKLYKYIVPSANLTYTVEAPYKYSFTCSNSISLFEYNDPISFTSAYLIAGDNQIFTTDWDIKNKSNVMANTTDNEYSLIKNDILLEKGIYNYAILQPNNINNLFIAINVRRGHSLKHGNTYKRKRLTRTSLPNEYHQRYWDKTPYEETAYIDKPDLDIRNNLATSGGLNINKMLTLENINDSFKFTLDEIKQRVNKDIIRSAIYCYNKDTEHTDELHLVFKFILTDKYGRKYKTINKAASYTFKLSDFIKLEDAIK